jgi:hypothetical protein
MTLLTWSGRLWLALGVVGCSGNQASLGSGVPGEEGSVTHDAGETHDAWYDAGGPLPSCPADAGFFNDNGGGGYQPSALPSGPCSVQAACFISIATGPFCGNPRLPDTAPGGGESPGFDEDVCECIRSRWACVVEDYSSAGVTRTWCDGGPGYTDGG